MDETQASEPAETHVDALPFLELSEQHQLPQGLQGAEWKADQREKTLQAAHVLACAAQDVKSAATPQDAQQALQALLEATESQLLHDHTAAAKSKLAFCVSMLAGPDDRREFCILQLTAAAEELKRNA